MYLLLFAQTERGTMARSIERDKDELANIAQFKKDAANTFGTFDYSQELLPVLADEQVN